MFYNGKVSSSTLLPTLQLARKATLWFPRNARRRPRDRHQLVLVCDTEVREHECAGLITIHDCMSWTGVHHEWISGDVHVVDERRKRSQRVPWEGGMGRRGLYLRRPSPSCRRRPPQSPEWAPRVGPGIQGGTGQSICSTMRITPRWP